MDKQIDANTLREIEESFSKVSWNDQLKLSELIPMSIYQGIYFRSFYNDTFTRIIKGFARYYLTRFGLISNWKKKHGVEIPKEIQKGDWLLCYLSDKEHFIKMMEPVRKATQHSERISALAHTPKIRDILPSGTPIVSEQTIKDHFGEPDTSSFTRFMTSSIKSIRLTCKKYGIRSSYVKINLITDLKIQISLYELYRKYLQQTQPECIIVPCDRLNSYTPLVLAARSLNITTISLMHGIIYNDFGYRPVLANKLFVWGEMQREQLVSLGEFPEKIDVAGAPQFNGEVSGNKKEIIKRLGLQEDLKTALLATSNIEHQNITESTAFIFAKALSKMKSHGWQGIVKLHPREDKKYYQDLLKDYNNIIIASKNDLNVNDALIVMDNCCFYSTAFAFEAIIAKVPVVLINPDSAFLGESKLLMDSGKVSTVINEHELIELLKNWDADKTIQEQKILANSICLNLGAEAGEDIVRKARQLINTNKKLSILTNHIN